MKPPVRTILSAGILLAAPAWAAGPPAGPLKKCPVDSVVSGTVCMDKYEASVWRVPNPTTTNKALVARIQNGKVTVGHLTASGATPLGTGMSDDYAPCNDGGQNCTDDIFAVSVPNVAPSSSITWFQALAACENSRKRLPTNAEWQAAVIGTPDPGADDSSTTCNSEGMFKTATGARSACKSFRGAYDMVGNVDEWVADWVPQSIDCGEWPVLVSPTGDLQCVIGAATSGEPGALLRGGSGLNAATAGPLTVGAPELSLTNGFTGFRCAR